VTDDAGVVKLGRGGIPFFLMHATCRWVVVPLSNLMQPSPARSAQPSQGPQAALLLEQRALQPNPAPKALQVQQRRKGSQPPTAGASTRGQRSLRVHRSRAASA
jgi:hypothetical protein